MLRSKANKHCYIRRAAAASNSRKNQTSKPSQNILWYTVMELNKLCHTNATSAVVSVLVCLRHSGTRVRITRTPLRVRGSNLTVIASSVSFW
mmetsp:Transcript_25311/g.76787  ORF Transcript_25311/g.76787 Transcript_25311/m.76787 type:complete len:92 (-) Transcript_25311:3927-4202(-)